jgi:hypothetical protein
MKTLLYILLIFYNPVSLFANQDCSVLDYETDSFSIGFKSGGFGYGVGPEVSWSSSNGTRWNDALQYMVAEYQELCSRYNTGRISDAEYKKEVDLIIKRSRGYTLELNRMFREKKNLIFNEMNREVSR